jgi:hypothetical protein
MRRSGVSWLVALIALLVACTGVSSAYAYASAGFGIERFALTAAEENSSADIQAGSHPYELTAEAVLESSAHNTSNEVKDLNFELPPGLILNPAAVPHCSFCGI